MNKITISGVIGGWEVDPADIVSQINSKTGDLEIDLDSVGGSVVGGISIANAIRDYDKGKVTIVVNAVSASIASYFMMFADEVKVHDNSTMMIHNAWLPAVGDFKALRKAADISEGLSSIIAKAYVSKTNKSLAFVKNMMDEETFFYGEEIVTNGFADELIKTESDKDKASAQALALEGLKACNNSIMKNENISFEAAAKLIPEKEEVEIITAVVDLSAQQQRERTLYILDKENK